MKRVKVYIDTTTFRINGMNEDDDEAVFVDTKAWNRTNPNKTNTWQKFYIDILTPEVFWKGTACPAEGERGKVQFTAHSKAFFLRFAPN